MADLQFPHLGTHSVWAFGNRLTEQGSKILWRTMIRSAAQEYDLNAQ
jgi:hypothetical protein